MTTVQRWSGRETRALRLAQRMSTRGFAARLGVNERTVTNWEARGESICPRPEMQAALDTTLRRANDDVRARFEVLLQAGPECGEQEVSPVPTRRQMLGYGGAGLTAIGLEQLAVQRARLPRVVDALLVTQTAQSPDAAVTLDSINVLVEHYKQTFRGTSPSDLYAEILAVRAHAGTLLDRAPGHQRSDSARAVGWLSNLLALVTHDLCDRTAALVWCVDAEERSREAGCPELAGWAAHTRVLMSFYDGHAGEAVDHAQRGQRSTPAGTVVHAKLMAQEMRAWALLGNSDKVHETRRRAARAIEMLPADASTHGTFSISLAEDPPYTGTSLLLLGRFEEAAEATRRVIRTWYGSRDNDGRGENPSGFARTYLILALALAGLGKIDEAYDAGTTALQTPRLVWPVAVLARRLDRTLVRDFAGTAEARDYHDRYIVAVAPGGR